MKKIIVFLIRELQIPLNLIAQKGLNLGFTFIPSYQVCLVLIGWKLPRLML